MGGKFKREGIYVYLWLIHVEVLQNRAKFCKAIILQLKINYFLKNLKKKKRKKCGKCTKECGSEKEKRGMSFSLFRS